MDEKKPSRAVANKCAAAIRVCDTAIRKDNESRETFLRVLEMGRAIPSRERGLGSRNQKKASTPSKAETLISIMRIGTNAHERISLLPKTQVRPAKSRTSK